MNYFNELISAFSRLKEVQALVLGGSRSTSHNDETSDYDLYVYVSEIPELNIRKEILENTCQYIELHNHWWEIEDDCTLKDGTDIDIIYRNLKDIENGLISTVEKANASTGYTTCIWHNVLNSKIIYDPEDKFQKLQERFNVPYPEKLKENIINKNRPLLEGMLPSYDRQLTKALKRGDLVSVNHRTTVFLESYFDILFALNRKTHPGEKRLLSYELPLLPKDHKHNVEELLTNPNPDIIREIISNLDELL